MRLILAILTLFGYLTTQAQYQHSNSNYWAFGRFAGIDFNIFPPRPVVTSINTGEGSAAICDKYGDLLFYTDGTTLWNNLHSIMSNGSRLNSFSTYSSTQAAVIVPIPNNNEQYYVFSLQSFDNSLNSCKLAYSKVDMSLGGGLGAVIASEKAILLDSLLSEKMVAVAGKTGDIWLIVHKRHSNEFLAYNISCQGIADPVYSAVGEYRGTYEVGMLKASPNGKWLALQNQALAGSASGTELYNFNAYTGVVSNCKVIDADLNSHYGLEFSPNSRYLYTDYQKGIKQYDLYNMSNTSSPVAKIVDSFGNTCGLALGPDDKIYVTNYGSNRHLSTIYYPNSVAEFCAFMPNNMELAAGTQSILGLPNYVIAGIDTTHLYDTIICISATTTLSAKTKGLNYIWNDGLTSATRPIMKSGLYWCKVQTACKVVTDTIIVNDCKNWVPNVFTPDGNGMNDAFKLVKADLVFTSFKPKFRIRK